MKTVATLALAGAAVEATTMSFADFARKHGKKYASREELVLRRGVYAANAARVAAHNAEGHSWSMGMNKFGDLTGEEFKARFASGYRAQDKQSRNVNLSLLKLKDTPTEWDWTRKGAVTPVKNQQQCGSCWAFSTTGSVEGAWFIAKGQLVSLSEQQLVDCSGAQGNQGCNGGLMDNAFQYIIANNGICAEAAYPYTAETGTCPTTLTCTSVATISAYTDVPTNSETALVNAAYQQPVSVAVEADQSNFQFYTGGVMTAPCGTQLDHGVLVVGYGTDANGGDYYKVKNSWGNTWGEEGYIRLGRGDSFGTAGQCGIQTDPSYPTV